MLDLGFLDVIIEGNALFVIKKCSNDSSNKSVISAHIKSIKQLVSIFHSVSFRHINISGNSVAHSLASECLKEGVKTYLENVVLGFVQRVVVDEFVRELD